MDQQGLKEGLRKHAMEMVKRVSAKMPRLLRRFWGEERDGVNWERDACGAGVRKRRMIHRGLFIPTAEVAWTTRRRDKHLICRDGDVVAKRKPWWYRMLPRAVTVDGALPSEETILGPEFAAIRKERVWRFE